MEFIKKNIVWIMGVLIIGLMAYILYLQRKKGKTTLSTGNMPVDQSKDNNQPIIIGDVLDPDPDADPMPTTDVPIGTGLNILNNTDVPNVQPYQINDNQMGFNSFDATGSRLLSIPLQTRKKQVYIEPFNQWGGEIRSF